MCHADYEKWILRNNGRNRTALSEKNQNVWGKGKLQVLGNNGCGQVQTSGDKGKIRKRVIQMKEKISRSQALRQESYLSN